MERDVKKEIELKTTFLLDGKVRISKKNLTSKKGCNTIRDLCIGINCLAWNAQSTLLMEQKLPYYLNSISFIRLCNQEIEKLALYDEIGNRIELAGRHFCYETYGELSYIYGEVTEDVFVTPKDTYIRCLYVDERGAIKRASFAASNSAYEKVMNIEPCFSNKRILFGLVIRKKNESQRMQYDKFSHTLYPVGNKKVKEINRLVQFCLLDCSEHGVICQSEYEKECYDLLTSERMILKKPLSKNREYGYTPWLYGYKAGMGFVIEAMQLYPEKEREIRKKALEQMREKQKVHIRII